MQVVTHTYTVTYDPDGAGPEGPVTRTITEVDYLPEPGEDAEARTAYFEDGELLRTTLGAGVTQAPDPAGLTADGVFSLDGAPVTDPNAIPSMEAFVELVNGAELPLDLSGMTFDFDLDLAAARAAGLVPPMGADEKWDHLFERANLQGATFNGTVTEVNFSFADLSGATFTRGCTHCYLQEVLLLDATMGPSSENVFIGANLSGATLTGEWQRNNFLFAEFTGADLTGVTSLAHSSFAHAVFDDARFPPAWTDDPAFTANSVFTGTGLPGDDGLAHVQLNTPEIIAALGGPAGIAALAAEDRLFDELERVLLAQYGADLDGRLNELWRAVLWDHLISHPDISPLKALVFDEAAGPHDGSWGRGYDDMIARYGAPTLRFWYDLPGESGTYPARQILEDYLVRLLLAGDAAYLDDPFLGARAISHARQP